MTKQTFDKQTVAKIIVLFVISYAIMFFSSAFFYKWDSPMYFLPPIVGFVVAFLMVDWISDFFETKAAHGWYFPVIILALAFVAEYITLFWYYNWGRIAGQAQYDFDFLAELKNSAFLPFVFSIVLGWLSHLIIDGTQQTGKQQTVSKKKK